jgi:DUF4097 and DUF4098 domain-containing protein YvlB
LLALIVAVLGASTGCNVKQIAINTIDLEKFDASATIIKEIPYSGERIFIDGGIGVVSIKGQTIGFVPVRPFITVEAVKKVRGVALDTLNVTFEQNANKKEVYIQTASGSKGQDIQIRGVPPKIVNRFGWVEYTIKVPQNAALSIHQDVGFINISEFKGDLTASVNFGKISVDGSELTKLVLDADLGDLHLSKSVVQEIAMATQLGDVKLEEMRNFATAQLSASAGSVLVMKSRGQKLNVTNRATGDISVTQSEFEGMHLSTQAGSIKLTEAKARESQLRTQLGSITLELSRSESIRLTAQTQFGGIKLRGQDRRVKAQWSGFWPGKQLMLTVGEGRDEMALSTQVGSIRITFVDRR